MELALSLPSKDSEEEDSYVAGAEEASEKAPDVMAQHGHSAQGHVVQCTLLDHPTPHQQEQVGAI